MDKNSPPDRVWLQWYGEDDPDEGVDFLLTAADRPGEVTWADSSVFNNDPEYLLATAARRLCEDFIPRASFRNVELPFEALELAAALYEIHGLPAGARIIRALTAGFRAITIDKPKGDPK